MLRQIRKQYKCVGKSENSANCWLFGSANKALCSGRPNSLQLVFSAHFLWFFLWAFKERTRKVASKK
jgi:hypothetical protein